MTPDEVPAELKAMLDADAGKDHSAVGAVMTSLAAILTRYRLMVYAEVDGVFKSVQALRKAERETDDVTTRLMVAYRGLVIGAGLAVGDEVRELERTMDNLICQCCAYGNHSIKCTCSGDGCCHPEAYLEYDPTWGHGGTRE